MCSFRLNGRAVQFVRLIHFTAGDRRGDRMIQTHRFDEARVFDRERRRAVELDRKSVV